MKRLLFFLSLLTLPSLLNAQTLTVNDIGVMHRLKMRIQFSDEREAHVVPADILPAKVLETELLDVSGSPLYEVPPWLKRFTNLRKLDLSDSSLGKESAIAVATLAELSNALQAMPQLNVLNLADNPLFSHAADQSLAPVWQSLPHLSKLNLSNTQGTAKNYGSLAALTALSELNLSRNRIGNELAGLELNKLRKVIYLNLSGNSMSTFPEQGLPTTVLQQLDMSDNSLKEIPFVDMPELESWNLQGNGAVRLAFRYGSSFLITKIRQLIYDSGSNYDNLSKLPKGLPEKVRSNACAQGKIKIGQYADNCDGTVTDTTTGLMWKQCSEGLSGVHCEEGEAKKYTWDDAVSRFKNVEYADYNDWRLPTIDELKTLVYCSNGVKDKDNGECNDGSKKPTTINQQAFPNTPATSVWSGSPHAYYTGNAWKVHFNYGNSYSNDRSSSYAVRLVRGGQ
ncbi:Leucine rich repeat-containing protein [Candidatus Electrothrix laxa]